MSKVKQGMVSSILSTVLVVVLINSSLSTTYAAPQAGAASAAGAGGAAGASSATTTTTTSQTATSASGAAGAAAAAAGAGNPLSGVQGLVGGAFNIASMPLNTITASLSQLGLPTIATAPLSAVSNLFAQAGTVYGR